VAPTELQETMITAPGQAVVDSIVCLRLERDRFAELFLINDA